jgi:hypothetical protein
MDSLRVRRRSVFIVNAMVPEMEGGVQAVAVGVGEIPGKTFSGIWRAGKKNLAKTGRKS